jgi:NADPH:quinone reductase
VLRDLLQIVRPRGRVCPPGFLGGLEPVTGFNPIACLSTVPPLSFYGSALVLGTPGFPLAHVPLQQMIGRTEDGRYHAELVRVFGFHGIDTAHQVMEEGLAAGKMVVAVSWRSEGRGMPG